MRAILYSRVSTWEQVENGYSLQQQTDRLRAHCEERGIEVAGVTEDAGVSGAVLERPGLMEALEAVADGRADTILAQDVDRVSREPWHFGYLQAKLAEYGGTLRTLDDEGDGSPEGEFFRDIRRSMAKMEKGITRRRTQRDASSVRGRVRSWARPPPHSGSPSMMAVTPSSWTRRPCRWCGVSSGSWPRRVTGSPP